MLQERNLEINQQLKKYIRKAIKDLEIKKKTLNLKILSDNVIDNICRDYNEEDEEKFLKDNNIRNFNDIKAAICAYIMYKNKDVIY